ncbi:MAG: hypothetical protein RLZ98_178 [Pseudomonadota bacterium]|jgi:flavorubredoxin
MIFDDDLEQPKIPEFPRQIAPDTWWFSTCLEITVHGRKVHNHNSCYLIAGTDATVMIDTGMPLGWDVLKPQIETVLAGRPLDYIFPTHPEAPHMGNAQPLMDIYPDLMLVGDLRTYHLYLPGEEHRFRHVETGYILELGGRRLEMVPALVHDLPNTLWGYDPELEILFVSDAYPYTHDHMAGQCAMISSELPRTPVAEDTSRVIEGALNWTRFVDPEVIACELDAYLERYPTRIIAPAHGAVTIEPEVLTNVFKSGLRRVSVTS